VVLKWVEETSEKKCLREQWRFFGETKAVLEKEFKGQPREEWGMVRGRTKREKKKASRGAIQVENGCFPKENQFKVWLGPHALPRGGDWAFMLHGGIR